MISFFVQSGLGSCIHRQTYQLNPEGRFCHEKFAGFSHNSLIDLSSGDGHESRERRRGAKEGGGEIWN